MTTSAAPKGLRIYLLLGLLLSLTAIESQAMPVYFDPTGHYYEFVRNGEVAWTDAVVLAGDQTWNGMTGHLATITSQDENDFVYENFGPHFWEAWLGAYQDPTSDPGLRWHWVTGESWDYTNWGPQQPDDAGGHDKECYLQMWGDGTSAPGTWNDDALATHPANISGYLVEYGTTAPVPEPGTAALLALGLGALTLIRRRRAR